MGEYKGIVQFTSFTSKKKVRIVPLLAKQAKNIWACSLLALLVKKGTNSTTVSEAGKEYMGEYKGIRAIKAH